MNAPIQKFAAAALVALLAGTLSACAGRFDPATDATSPVAPRVQALVDANREYPRWADFPKVLEPLPQPAAIAAQVNALRTGSSDLAAAAARLDWQATGDPEALAAEARARVAATPVAPVSAQSQAEIEAYLRRARERGRAPPPIDRR
jgi:hypothetical protein